MSTREIIVRNLVKRYGDFSAVNDVSLEVGAGRIFGFLGPNGAGKSTTVKIMTTLALPTEGDVWVGGYSVRSEAQQIRQIAGVALQEIGLDPLMKSTELLTMQGQFFGMGRREALARARELLEIVRLSDAVDKRVGKYSGGMRRRLDLALALVHQPEILFLDEPTTGLDPASRRDVWEEVRRLNRELGMTIFLTTQYMEEADELADDLAIIDQGQIVAAGSPGELKARLSSDAINVTFEDEATVARAQTALEGMADQMQADRRVLRLYLDRAAEAVPAVVTRLQAADLQPIALTLTQPTLDDVFLAVTGQRFQAAAEPAGEQAA
ncbi:MAG: ATP-binding cassette domain-containing protein [Anaerolineae bacterium]|nr:ATP-binding cassette domain-containing protein [Anaerolineae bacterium]